MRGTKSQDSIQRAQHLKRKELFVYHLITPYSWVEATHAHNWKLGTSFALKNGSKKEISVLRASCITNSDYVCFAAVLKKSIVRHWREMTDVCTQELCIVSQWAHDTFLTGTKKDREQSNQIEMGEQKLAICPQRTNNHV